jgi:hypothetical protein
LSEDVALDLAAYVRWMESMAGLAAAVRIKLEYDSDSGRRNQEFALQGWMQGGWNPSSSRMKQDGTLAHVSGGLGAAVDNVMVVPYERK